MPDPDAPQPAPLPPRPPHSNPSEAPTADGVTDPMLALRVVPMPRDTNAYGTIFGGVIMSYIDQAGLVEAIRHAPCPWVTASVERIDFDAPVHLGDVVSLYTRTERTGRTSIRVRVEVEAMRRGTKQIQPVTTATLTMVAVDDAGRPTPFTHAIPAGRHIRMSIAHAEGRYVHDDVDVPRRVRLAADDLRPGLERTPPPVLFGKKKKKKPAASPDATATMFETHHLRATLRDGIVVGEVRTEQVTDREARVLLEEIGRATEESGSAKVVLDMRHVGVLASAGIGALVQVHKKLKAGGGGLAIYALSEDIEQLMKLTRMDKLFGIEADRDAAIARLS